MLARTPRAPGYTRVSIKEYTTQSRSKFVGNCCHLAQHTQGEGGAGEEEFITSGNSRGKHNSLWRGGDADPP